MQILIGIFIPFVGTALGAACVFFMKDAMNQNIQKALLGFASGVMVAASVWSLLIPAIEMSEDKGQLAFLPAAIGFVLGILFLLGMDHLIPHLHMDSDVPEGMPSKLKKTTMMVLAVTLHNIPEGIAVAVPIFYATGNRKKAFWYSLVSGLAEPVGAIIGYLLLMPFMSETVNAVVFAVVAGIMVFISVNELLPSAQKYCENHTSIYGLVCGMLVMAVSLIGFM